MRSVEIFALCALGMIVPSQGFSATGRILDHCKEFQISGDGTAVVWETPAQPPLGDFAIYRMNLDTGEVTGGATFPESLGINDVSADGRVATGIILVGTIFQVADFFQIGRWTESSGVSLLELYPRVSMALYRIPAVSGDGKTIVSGQSPII